MPLPSGWTRVSSKEAKPRQIENKQTNNSTVLYYRHREGYVVYADYHPVFRKANESPYVIYIDWADAGVEEHGKREYFGTFKETRKECRELMEHLNMNHIDSERYS